MTLKYFNSKEEYNSYIKSWKFAINNERAKSKVIIKKYLYTDEYYTFRQKGWLQSEHFLLHNILLNKDLENGFTPITNKNKLLLSKFHINNGFHTAVEKLNKIISIAKWINGEKNKIYDLHSNTYKRLLEQFLEPYSGSITVDILCKIKPLNSKPIYSDFGIGLKMVEKIIDENIKFDNYQHFYSILNKLKC